MYAAHDKGTYNIMIIYMYLSTLYVDIIYKAALVMQQVCTINTYKTRYTQRRRSRAGLCNSPGPMVVVITLLRMSVIYNIYVPMVGRKTGPPTGVRAYAPARLYIIITMFVGIYNTVYYFYHYFYIFAFHSHNPCLAYFVINYYQNASGRQY